MHLTPRLLSHHGAVAAAALADVETGFFARWWDEQDDARRNITKGLVASGQLEFINGAWCVCRTQAATLMSTSNHGVLVVSTAAPRSVASES